LAVPHPTAGSITIDSTGSSEQEAVQAADAVAGLARDLTVEEASAATRTAIAGLEQVVAGSTERLRLADERLAAMEAAGETPGPTNPAVLERTAAADALAVATSELEQARSELEALSSGTVTVVEASASPADPSILVPLALAALAAGLAFLALLAVQALDGRIRRRIHIERSAPRVRVIGVLSKSPSDAELALATRGTQRFMADNGLQRLLVVPLKGEASEELLEALADVAGGAVQPLDRGGALGELGTPEVGVLFEVPFGRVQEDVLQSAVTDAATVGTTAVAAMITGVPSADQAWASVSIH
jgi:hypothetical protein